MNKKDEQIDDKKLDDALAEFTDDLLSGKTVALSADLEMQQLQKVVQQFHQLSVEDQQISVKLQKIKQNLKGKTMSKNQLNQKEENQMSWFGKYGRLAKIFRQTPAWVTGLVAVLLVAGVVIFGNSTNLLGTAVINGGVVAKTAMVTIGDNEVGNGESKNPDLSGNGRYLVFQSNATNLGVESGNSWQIYLYDQARDFKRLITHSMQGEQVGGNGDSSWATISDDGRYILFQSKATDLVAQNTDGVMNQLYLYDVVLDETLLISQKEGVVGNGDSRMGSISADGSFIVFESAATNLGSTTALPQIYLYERASKQIKIISASDDGYHASSVISDNGQWIAYQAQQITAGQAANPLLWEIKLYNRVTNERKSVTTAAGAPIWGRNVDLSADGAYLVFESSMGDLADGDTNQSSDIFLYEQSNQAISVISYKDRLIGQSFGNGDSQDPVISGDGQFVAFSSLATNLVNNVDTAGILLWNRTENNLSSMNFSSNMENGNLGSFHPTISNDGRFIAFWSLASNLSPKVADTNNQADLFLRDLTPDPIMVNDTAIVRPGSTIILDVAHFKPSAQLSVKINGRAMGQASTGEFGQAELLFDTAEAGVGDYFITLVGEGVNGEKEITVRVKVDPTGLDIPLQPGTINMQSFSIPEGEGLEFEQMIPIFIRP